MDGKQGRFSAMKVVKGLSKSITEINATFIDIKVLLYSCMTNVFSTAEDPSQQVRQILHKSFCLCTDISRRSITTARII